MGFITIIMSVVYLLGNLYTTFSIAEVFTPPFRLSAFHESELSSKCKIQAVHVRFFCSTYDFNDF